MFYGETIWVIGASSGIGKALAQSLSEQGAKLIISARREDALKQVADSLVSLPIVLPLDVTAADQLAAACQAVAGQGKINRIIFMSAVYERMYIPEWNLSTCQRIVTTNLIGAVNVLHYANQLLVKQGYGQLVLCASVSGFVGLPNAQPYAATKAGIISLCETAYTELKPLGVDVKVINPGFVATPLTAKNTFHMPNIISPAAAANYICRGLVAKKFNIDFPLATTFTLRLLSWLPYPLYFMLAQKVLRKLKAS